MCSCCYPGNKQDDIKTKTEIKSPQSFTGVKLLISRNFQLRRAEKEAKKTSATPVFSGEGEARPWGDTCMDGNVSDVEEQDWAERENGTVFVIPTTPPDVQCRWEYLKGAQPDCTSLGWMSELQDGDTTTLGSSSEDTLSRDLERVSLGSLGKWTWDIHSIIIDLSTANFIDTVAIKTIKNVSVKAIVF